jgi:ABC-2 type transport system ATP-binding protein
LILDEPAASLDPQGRRDVLEVMSRIRKYATILYCTHILDDVQRVSDQVAIVNKGELIAQASIDELLAGTGETVYAVTLRGEPADAAYTQVKELAWVSGIEVSQRGDQTLWEISVTDEAAAEDELLGLLVSGGLKVADFGRKEYNLEDVFLGIVEGASPEPVEGGQK